MRTKDERLPQEGFVPDLTHVLFGKIINPDIFRFPEARNGRCLTLDELTTEEWVLARQMVCDGRIEIESIDGLAYVRPALTVSELYKGGWVATGDDDLDAYLASPAFAAACAEMGC